MLWIYCCGGGGGGEYDHPADPALFQMHPE